LLAVGGFAIDLDKWFQAQHCEVGTNIQTAAHPTVAEVLERWEHVRLPVVLIGLGVAMLVQSGALGL